MQMGRPPGHERDARPRTALHHPGTQTCTSFTWRAGTAEASAAARVVAAFARICRSSRGDRPDSAALSASLALFSRCARSRGTGRSRHHAVLVEKVL